MKPDDRIEGQVTIWEAIAETERDQALARRGDPGTSHAAAASVRVRESQQLVLRLLRERGPVTDEALFAYAQSVGAAISPSGLRSRRAELVRHGLVVDTGARDRTKSGRQSIIWGAP